MSTTPPPVPTPTVGAPRSPLTILACLVPVALVVALNVIHALAPEFYLEYVINFRERERQAVEIVTFSSSIVGGLLALATAARLWFSPARRTWMAGIAGMAMIGAAAVFFALEEVSWGQTWLGWETPPEYKEFSGETNLHNTDIPVQTLGAVFVIGMLVALPLAWRYRRRWTALQRLPDALAPMIAEAPAITAVVVAFVWREYKDVYRLLTPNHEEVPYYIDFVEQINEHKEMLVGVALLMYGLYRLRWWRAAYGARSDERG